MHINMKLAIINITIYLFFSIYTITPSFSQTPYIQWQKSFGGSSFDFGYSILQSSDGGFLLAGASNSTDIQNVINHGRFDFLVIKIDQCGNISWNKTFGGSDHDIATSAYQTSDGGYVICGFSYSNDGDVHGHVGSYLDRNFWIIKIDALGNLIWEKSYAKYFSAEAYSVQETYDGGYIVAGLSYFGDLIIKLDNSGNESWDTTFAANNHIISIQQTTDHGFIVGGYSPNSIYQNDNDYLIVKLDLDGHLQWQKNYDFSTSDKITAIQQTFDGGYIVKGSIYCMKNTSLGQDSVAGHHGLTDYYILKLNQQGNIIWSKLIGGSLDEFDEPGYCQRNIQTTDGGYVFSGNTYSIDGDIHNSYGSGDICVYKSDQMGNLLWLKTLGGISFDHSNSIVQTVDGGYILAGESYSNDFDLTQNMGYSDIWIVKLQNKGAFISPDTNVSFCEGDSILLTASNGSSYFWCTGQTTQSIYVSNIGNYFVRVGGCANSDTVRPIVTDCRIEVSTNVFIEGLYIGNGLMNSPINQNLDSTICDTVILCLANTLSPYEILYQDTSILKKNGDAVFMFPKSLIGQSFYYILKHRNSLQIWSATPQLLDSMNFYSFTRSTFSTLGLNIRILNDGKCAMYSGDINQDGIIDVSDFTILENSLNQTPLQYDISDLTGDGIVESADYSIVENNIGIRIIMP